MADGTKFWRKTNVTHDTELSQVYGDTADGNSGTIDIQGGKDRLYGLFDATIAEAPRFGSAELKDYQFNIYADSFTLGDTGKLPKLSIYKNNKPMGDNEGTFTIGEKDILVFGAYDDVGLVWTEETFDKTLSTAKANEVLETFQGTVQIQSEPWIHAKEAHDAAQADFWGIGDGKELNYTEFFERWGSYNVNGLPVVFVEAATNWPGDWKPVNGKEPYSNDPQWYEKKKRGRFHMAFSWPDFENNMVEVNYTNSVQIEQSPDPTTLTPFNSIFDEVRTHSPAFHDEHTSESPKYIGYSDIKQSTKNVASGGSAAELQCEWKTNATDGHIGGDKRISGDNNTATFYSARATANSELWGTTDTDGSVIGPAGRQEIFMLKKNVPMPVATQSGNFISGIAGERYYGEASIELDIIFDNLEAAYAYKSTSSGAEGLALSAFGSSSQVVQSLDPYWISLRRACVFLMTDDEPTESEDLYTFLSHNYIHNWHVNVVTRSAADGTSATTHTQLGIARGGVCGEMVGSDSKFPVVVGDRVYFEWMAHYLLNCSVGYVTHSGGGHETAWPHHGYVVTGVGDGGSVAESWITIKIDAGETNDPAVKGGPSDDGTGMRGTVFKYSNKNLYGMAFTKLTGGTQTADNATTVSTNISCVPFRGRNQNYAALAPNALEAEVFDSNGAELLRERHRHSWIPNAYLQDFACSTTNAGFNNTTLKGDKWYKLGFHWNPTANVCRFVPQFVDGATDVDWGDDTIVVSNDEDTPLSPYFMPNMKATTQGLLHGHAGLGAGSLHSSITASTWPSTLSFWMTNVDYCNQTSIAQDTSSSTNAENDMATQDGEINTLKTAAGARDTKSIVYMDKMIFRGFHINKENATQATRNKNFRRPITFYSGETRKVFSDTYGLSLKMDTEKKVNCILLGFKEKRHIEGAARYLLWNNFTTHSLSTLFPLVQSTQTNNGGSPVGNINMTFSSNENRGYQMPTANLANVPRSVLQIDTGDNDVITAGTMGMEKFTAKGFMKFDFVDTTAYDNSGGAGSTHTVSCALTEGSKTVTCTSNANIAYGQGVTPTSSFAAGSYVEYVNVSGAVTSFNVSTAAIASATVTLTFDRETMTKREHINASARVVDFNKGSNTSVTEIYIDNDVIFNIDDGDTFVLYRYDKSLVTLNNAITGITVLVNPVEVEDKHFKKIRLNTDVKDIVTDANMKSGDIFIGPERFWIMIEATKTPPGGSGTDATKSSYDSVLLGGALDIGTDSTNPMVGSYAGSTWNESLYNDTTQGAINAPTVNGWDMTLGSEFPIMEVSKDYGFGDYDPEKLDGGQITSFYADDGVFNQIGLEPMAEVNNELEPGETVSFIMKVHDDTVDHKVTWRSSEHSTTTTRPFLLTGFFDALPNKIEDFSVNPDEDNPSYPKFTWKANDDDLWYAFLIIDSKNISSQYHNSFIHYPMNVKGTHDAVITSGLITDESGSALTTINSGIVYDAEGLAGYAPRFDGAATTYVKGGTGSADPTGDATTELSVNLHIHGVSTAPAATQYLVFQENKIIIQTVAGGAIEALLYSDADSYVSLTSSSLMATDGETPMNIILTFDADIKSGNLKLYINGVLEDESGVCLSSHATGNNSGWIRGTALNTTSQTTEYLWIGNDESGADGFVGIIEEVVFYNAVIYPLQPEQGEFTFTKPVRELTTSTSATNLTHVARLFVKDYHNIRGRTIQDVRGTQNIAWRKAGFALDTS